jgi:hypothetical protein
MEVVCFSETLSLKSIYMPASHTSFVIAVKLNADEEFRMMAMLLFTF